MTLWFRIVGWFACLWHRVPEKFAVLVAQARHETGDFTSDAWRDLHNPWGIMAPTHYDVDGAGRGTNEGTLAKFSNSWNAWRSRLSWDERRNIDYQDEDQYMGEVKAHGYATDPKYLVKWKAWAKRAGAVERGLSNRLVAWAVLALLVSAIGATLWYLSNNRKSK